MKRAAGTEWPRITLHPVITNVTYQHLEKLVDLTAALECEQVSLSHLVFERDDEPGTAFRLDPAQRKALPGYVARAVRRAEELGVEAKVEGVTEGASCGPGRDYLGRTNFGDGRLSDANCFEVWLSCVMHVNGNVGPCCVSYEDRAENIKEASLRDVWLGPYMQEVRRRIVSDDLMPYCAGCPTYIMPRSEMIRHDLSDLRWQQWAAMSRLQKLRAGAGRFLGVLRQHGLRQTLERGLRWRKSMRARKQA